MTRKLAPLLAAAVLASGCTKMNDPEKVAPWENAENWCYAISDLVVTWLSSCEPMTPAYQDFYYRMYTELLDCAAIQGRVDAGRLRYDADQAKACLDQAASIGCFSEPAACASAVVGAVGPGGTCFFDSECRSDTLGCDLSATCPGSCTPLSGLGGTCGGQSDCQSGLYCDSNYAPPACQRRRAPYELCAAGDPPESCAEGYYCGFDGTQRCIPRPTLGQGCSPGSIPCDDRQALWCDAAICAQVPTSPSPIGGRCDGAYFCDEATAWCDSALKCQLRKARDLSWACASSEECQPPALCDMRPGEASSTCKSIPRLGEDCIGGKDECLAGAYCNAPLDMPGVCTADPTLGQLCNLLGVADGTGWCADGWCNTTASPGSQTCVPYGGVGDTCGLPGSPPCDSMGGLVCDANVCVAGTCGGGVF